MRVLYRGGTVYSDADPFATALLTDGGTVTWLGDEAGAAVREREADAVVDLAGRLLTPGFVDAGDPDPSAPLASHGVVAVVTRGAASSWIEGPKAQARLAQLAPGVVACLDPRTLPPATDLAALAARGVPLALGTAAGGEVDPWRLVQHALARGLSARAAFAAATRGAWRADSSGTPGGRLHVGAAASFVVWAPCELGVQVADERRSLWSSDARAGIPPLPVLGDLDDPTWRPPAAHLVVVLGQVVHRAHGSDTPTP